MCSIIFWSHEHLLREVTPQRRADGGLQALATNLGKPVRNCPESIEPELRLLLLVLLDHRQQQCICLVLHTNVMWRHDSSLWQTWHVANTTEERDVFQNVVKSCAKSFLFADRPQLQHVHEHNEGDPQLSAKRVSSS
jgi:hypothetical protein